MTGAEATSLGYSPEGLETARVALQWTRTVRASTVSDVLKELLLSSRASKIRAAVSRTADQWRQIEADRKAAIGNLKGFGAERIADSPAREFVGRLEELLASRRELPDYVALRRQHERLAAAGLVEFLACADRLALDPRLLPDLFRVIVANYRAKRLRQAPGLAAHSGSSLEARRRMFAERDRAKMASDRATIRTQLMSKSPPVGSNVGSKKTWTEMRLLHNEFAKAQRFTPPRQLFRRAARAIQTLKPCFMMSPLSLAKFVPAGSVDFDLLVIDEASQMRPEEALGGLLRARQIVVVGDLKQLPPTDFFSRADGQTFEGGKSDDDSGDDINAELILGSVPGDFQRTPPT